MLSVGAGAGLGQRLSSITTRIKTMSRTAQQWPGRCVRDYLPLQQGLRLKPRAPTNRMALSVRDYLPLQQGLRRLYIRGVFKTYFKSETIFHYNKD